MVVVKLSISPPAPPPHPHFVVKLIIILGCPWASFLWECILSLWPLLFSTPLPSRTHTYTRCHAHSHTNRPLSSCHSHLVSLWVLRSVFLGHNRAAGPNDSKDGFPADFPKIHFKFIWILFWPSNFSLPETIIIDTVHIGGNTKNTLCLHCLYYLHNTVFSAQIQDTDKPSRERLRDQEK